MFDFVTSPVFSEVLEVAQVLGRLSSRGRPAGPLRLLAEAGSRRTREARSRRTGSNKVCLARKGGRTGT